MTLDLAAHRDGLLSLAGSYSPPTATRARSKRASFRHRLSHFNKPFDISFLAQMKAEHGDPSERIVGKKLLRALLASCSVGELSNNINKMVAMNYFNPQNLEHLIKWAAHTSEPVLSVNSTAALGLLTFPVERVPGVKDLLFASNVVPQVVQVATDYQLLLTNEVNCDDLVISKKLGSGASGFVYRALYHGKEVAVKKFIVQGIWIGSKREFYYEAAVLSIFGCLKNFMHCYGVNFEEGVIVMPLAVHGSLHQALESGTLDQWDWKRRVRLASQIANASRRLHQFGILHRDLKPANILLDNQFNCYLADFGTSRKPEESGSNGSFGCTRRKRSMTMNVGTNIYMAPEMVQGDGAYDDSIDVYSFGMILWQIVTGCAHPYLDQKISLGEVADFVASGKRLSIPDDCPLELCDLIESCWSPQAKKRPEFVHIHQILSEML